ncbi:hypothetical protein RB195_018961 [Necator americanus]|uniref:KATNIP domain-containing protein n=1 Tax=Necator americanus TaxID=51031 RepID=A0ABR1CE21_NECAM
MTSTILRNELSMGDIAIRLELYDISGYRDFAIFTIDFTKPSPLTDLSVGFQNRDVRVYMNTQCAHDFIRSTERNVASKATTSTERELVPGVDLQESVVGTQPLISGSK